MTAPDLTPEQRATEPTEPGWYAYSGGRQTMIFHLRETRDWKMTASSANASKGMQWSAHFDNGTASDCAWGYIEQALGVWDLVRLDPGARAGVPGHPAPSEALTAPPATLANPTRIQRKRTKGWRMPEGTVYVGRGSTWGNPFALKSPSGLARVPAVDHPDKPWEYEGRISANGTRHDYFHPDGRVIACNIRWMTPAESVDCYRALLYGDGRWPLVGWRHNGGRYPHIKNVWLLGGKNLACWCPLDQPCHADVLLELANRVAS